MLWMLIVCISLASMCLKKFEKIVGLVSFFGLGYLAGTPDFQLDPDSLVYLQNYSTGSDYFESGYNWLAKVFEPHINYESFRLYSSLVVFVLLFLAVRMLTTHVSSVSFFYALALFPADKAQVRNCMAAVFILFGVVLLIKFGTKGILPSLALIYFGSLFHSLALFFLLIPVMWLFRKPIKNFFVPLTSILIFIAFTFELLGSTALGPVIANILGKIGSRASAAQNVSTIYAGGGQPLSHWLIFLGVTLFMIATALIVRRSTSDQAINYYEVFVLMTILWAVALTFMTLSIDYVRVLRISAYFYFIYVVNALAKENATVRGIGLTLGTMFALMMMWVELWTYGFNGDQVRAIFGFM